jgi:hypothetical protein
MLGGRYQLGHEIGSRQALFRHPRPMHGRREGYKRDACGLISRNDAVCCALVWLVAASHGKSKSG